jgi:hypothetical protein
VRLLGLVQQPLIRPRRIDQRQAGSEHHSPHRRRRNPRLPAVD